MSLTLAEVDRVAQIVGGDFRVLQHAAVAGRVGVYRQSLPNAPSQLLAPTVYIPPFAGKG